MYVWYMTTWVCDLCLVVVIQMANKKETAPSFANIATLMMGSSIKEKFHTCISRGWGGLILIENERGKYV